jgi:hypothetical protein
MSDEEAVLPSDRLLRILRQLRGPDDVTPTPVRLCEACADVVDMSGAGVMLMSGDLPLGSVCSSTPVSTVIEDLQYTLGEGPCVDAYHFGRPVLEPDLAAPAVPRWPGFTTPAVAAGARAVFGFPLEIGAVRLGALNFYRDEPGQLSDDQHADAIVTAGIAARAVLDLEVHAPDGGIASTPGEGSDYRFVVHQAAGMISVQLGVSVTEALIRLRAYAFANDRPINDVAHDVVARRVRCE